MISRRGWLLRWAGIDRNPLRRGIDRIQAAVWAESLMMFLAGALVVTLQVSHAMYISGLVYPRPAQRTAAGYEPASGNYEWCPNSNLFHSAEAAVPGPQATVLPGNGGPAPSGECAAWWLNRDEALRLFGDRGPDGVTIRDIAAAAGVSAANDLQVTPEKPPRAGDAQIVGSAALDPDRTTELAITATDWTYRPANKYAAAQHPLFGSSRMFGVRPDAGGGWRSGGW